jgi:prepilin signal peptidase PulO-like enzyme (type II secretory pathway)
MALAPTFIAFAPGLAAGGLLNTLASTLPERRMAHGVRPICSHCGHRLSVIGSVVLFSYLLRGGTCSHCGARRGLRYPLLELATGILWVACFARFGLSGRAFVAAAFCAVLLVLAAIDFERRIIPNAIVVPAGALILLSDIVVAPGRALEWTVAAFAAMLALFALALTYRGALGMGDAKLAFLLGAGLGKGVLFAFLAGLSGAALAAVVILASRGMGARKETIPLGPFLAAGAVVALLLS